MIILTLLLLIKVSIFSASDDVTNKKVLLLNSYHKGFLWTDEITRGITETYLKEGIELHIEYMDSKRQWDLDYQSLLTNLLEVKITKHSYDLIITSDDDAFNFAMQNRSKLFPNKPIVFCGLNYINKTVIAKYSNITGINEESNISRNIELISKNHPKIKKIIVITDNSTTGIKIQNSVKEISPLYANIDIQLVFNVSGEELVNVVEEINLDSIILFTIFFTDRNGVYFDHIIQDISKVAKVPIYGSWDFDLNKGIIGGDLIGGYQQGYEAAELSLSVLKGLDIDKVPVEYKTPTKIIFDYNQLKRFNINIDKTNNTKIINFPESFYFKYKTLIWVVIFILSLLIVVLFSVIFVLIKSKKTELKLTHYKDHLEEIVDDRTKELSTSLQDLHYAQDQLIESKNMAFLGSLVSGVAHEINTPVGIGITSISHQILLTKELDYKIINKSLSKSDLNNFIEGLINSLELSLANLNKAANIVNTFKKVAVESYHEEKVNINLHDFFSDIIDQQVPLGIKIYYFCEKSLTLETYPHSLIQIMSNLIINSIEHAFIGDKGYIDLVISRKNDKTIITYHDSGVGILPEHQDKIFDPFFTTKRVEGHIGLGLNIIYNNVINRLQGTVDCSSNPDTGTTFTIIF